MDQLPRILVVDDQVLMAEILVRMLSAHGFESDTALSGQEAVTACSRKEYDLIFLDCHMPEMDGCQCCKLLRAAEKGERRMMIIGWSGDFRNREKCLEAGMDDMITKPIVLDTLLETLSRWACR